MPGSGNKRRILAIRHGESEWNVLQRKYPSREHRYHERMWKTIDCSITDLGRQQARAAGTELFREWKTLSIDLLLISPLRRALQTATNLLETFPGNKPPKIEICKDATEVFADPCDIGSTPRVLKKEFPDDWNFSSLEDDYYWWHGGKKPSEALQDMVKNGPKGGLETEEDVHRRIEKLKKSIREREEEVIVVVCHSDTIWWLTRSEKNGEFFGERTDNGEILDITGFVLGH